MIETKIIDEFSKIYMKLNLRKVKVLFDNIRKTIFATATQITLENKTPKICSLDIRIQYDPMHMAA